MGWEMSTTENYNAFAPSAWNFWRLLRSGRRGSGMIATTLSLMLEVLMLPPAFYDNSGWNGSFIAACTGSAEAGWRSTITAIDGLDEMDCETHLWKWIADAIIAAWPEELL